MESSRPTEPKRASARPVTLKEVAAHAGVHASTVSRALSPATRHLVADAVAERVRASADALGYRPDHVAASLRTGRSHMVGVLVPDIANPVFSPILGGITEILSAEGYSTIIADVGNEKGRAIDLVESLRARRVDGLILATVSREDPVVAACVEHGMPLVLVNRTEMHPRVSGVVSDDVAGMKLAVDHLAALGHRRIGHVAGPAQLSTGFLRRRGFEAAMAERGLGGDAASAIETATAYLREAGATATRALLERHPETTAIIAANDLLALGGYDALAAFGLRCPGDVSIVGHNDMPFVDMVAPPLTTVRIGQREMGLEAATMLLREIGGAVAAKRTITLAPTLIVRGSTAAPKGHG